MLITSIVSPGGRARTRSHHMQETSSATNLVLGESSGRPRLEKLTRTWLAPIDHPADFLMYVSKGLGARVRLETNVLIRLDQTLKPLILTELWN